MNLTRRQFNRAVPTTIAALAMRPLLLGLAVGGAVSLEGCNVVSDIQAYIPVAEEALGIVVNLLTAAGVLHPGSATIVADADVAFAAILAAIQSYLNAPPADKATLLEKITTAVQSAENAIQAFLNQINIPGSNLNLLNLIFGLLNVILSTLAGFLGQLPVPVTMHLVMKYPVPVPLSITPKVRSVRAFKKDWNAVVKQYSHPEAQIHFTVVERFGYPR